MHPAVFLALLCGLLAKNVQGEINPHATISLSAEMLQHMISEQMDHQVIISLLQSLPIQEAMRNSIKESGGVGIFAKIPFFRDLSKDVYSGITGMKITSADVQEPNIYFDTTRNLISVNYPVEMVLKVDLPLAWGSILREKVSGVIKAEIWISEDEDGHQKLILGDCESSPDDIRITLLNGKASIFIAVNNLHQIMIKVLKEKLPDLLKGQPCQNLKGGINRMLDFLQDSPSYRNEREIVILLPFRFFIYPNALEIGYQAVRQLAEGENVELPPVSARLPQIVLTSEYVVISLISGPLCDAMMQIIMPPGTLKIDSEEEVENFQKQMNTMTDFSMPANTQITSMDISYGSPMLSITTGSIEAYQDIELNFYGTLPSPPNKHLYTIKMKIVFYVSISTDDAYLGFSLDLHRLMGIALIESNVGIFDPLRMRPAIVQLLSNTFIPYANDLLSVGFPLPLMKELGVEKINFAYGEDFLLLMA